MIKRWLQHFLLPTLFHLFLLFHLFHITIASGLQASYNQLRYVVPLLLQLFSSGHFFVTRDVNKHRIASRQRQMLQVLLCQPQPNLVQVGAKKATKKCRNKFSHIFFSALPKYLGSPIIWKTNLWFEESHEIKMMRLRTLVSMHLPAFQTWAERKPRKQNKASLKSTQMKS